jgi:hypothetical protein
VPRLIVLSLLLFAVRAAASIDAVVAVTSDYSVSGAVSTVEVLPPWLVETGVASVHSDAVGREHDGLVYIVNRLYGDNIQVLDPGSGFSTVRQFSVGPGTSPQDIAFVADDRAYVPLYESTWLLEVDPTTGTVTDSIDLSGLADADGLPEMGHAVAAAGYIFVAIQRIDRDVYWTPVPPSYLAVIDPSTNALVDVDPVTPGVQSIELAATNPYGEIVVEASTGHLLVPESGNWGSLDGGVEVIDPVNLTSLGFITSEAQLGGDLNDVTLDVSGRSHAMLSVASPGWESYVVAWDRATGDLIGDVYRPGGWTVADIEVHAGTGQLFVSDRTYSDPGVRVFDATSGLESSNGSLFVGLPPHDLILLGDDVTGVVAPPRRLHVWPNPVASVAHVCLATPAERPLKVDIYDVAGRLVDTVNIPARGTTARWTGGRCGGTPVASGVYFARVRNGAERVRFVVLR